MTAGGNSGNTIGGFNPDGNIIAYNTGDGIVVATGTSDDNVGNAIEENSIHDNGGLGIDLGDDGITPNDFEDADAGPNDGVNVPVLSNFDDGGEGPSDGTVDISLDAEPGADYLIQIYGSSSCDPSGSGEGATFIDSVDVTTDLYTGEADVTGFYLETGGMTYLTATTTDYNFNGSTSEFSVCLNVGTSGAPTDLALDVSPGTTDAGWSQLPEEQLSLEGASLETGQLEASAGPTAAPLGKNPLGKNPLGKNPLGKNPLGKNPLGKNPLGKNPLGLNLTDPPLRNVPVSALVAHQLPDAPLLTDLPTTHAGGWPALLGVDTPEQSLTLNNALTAGALASVTIPEIDWSGTRFADLSPGAWLLGATPMSNIALPTGTWSGLRALMGPGCSSFSDSSTLLDLQWARCDLSIIPWDGIQLSDITNLNASPLGAYKLDGIVLALTPIGEVASSSFGALISCATPCPTVAEAQDQDGIVHTASVRDLPAGVLTTTTLGDLLPGMMDVTQYPYESLSITQIIRSVILDPEEPVIAAQPTVTYTASFTTTCPTGALQVTLDLPNARYRVVPGSAQWSFDDGPGQDAGEPGTESETFDPVWQLDAGSTPELSGCTNPVVVDLSVDVIPGPDAGTFLSGLDVATDSFPTESIDDAAPLTVVDGSEAGNAVGSATSIVPDTLYTGTIGGSTDVDYFTMPLPSPAASVAVYLTHLPEDLDTVMYGPTSSSPVLRSADLNLHPLGKNPIDDSGSCLPADYVVQPQTLEDVPVVENTLAVRSFSTNRSDQQEVVCTVGREGDTGNLTIQVSGFNGDHSDHPYVLRAIALDPPGNPACTIPSSANTGTPLATPSVIPASTRTLFLINADRFGDTYGAAGQASVLSSLNTLAARSEVAGVVLPIENNAGVASAYAALNSSRCSTAAANGVVRSINAYVDNILQTRNLRQLRFIVLVGADNIIPFARIPDLTQLGNQTEYTADLRLNGVDNPASRAAAQGFYLSDDPYGSFHPIPWSGDRLYLPDVSVGRLVETPAQIVNQISQYISANGVLAPTSALVTGYDFTADSAKAIADSMPSTTTVSRLIDTPGVNDGPPSEGWNRATLLARLNAAPRIIALNGHFDHFRTLTAGGDIASTTDFGGTSVPFGSLLFTLGCNSGISMPNVWITGTSPATLDWAEALSVKRSSLVANTGFGYGDDTTIAYSEELMRLFARNLDGSMSIGQAHAFAKSLYYGGLSAVSSYDLKAMQESVFYGLPMQRFGSTGVIAAPSSSGFTTFAANPDTFSVTALTSDADTGLDSVDVPINPFMNPAMAPTGDRHTTPDGDYFTGPAIQETQYRPLEPTSGIFDMTFEGHQLHDAIVTELRVQDLLDFDPVMERPLIDQAGPEPLVNDVAFPTDFVATASAATVLGRRDYLVVNGGRFVSDPLGTPGHGTQRLHLDEAVRAFYSNSTDYTRPQFEQVNAYETGSASFVVEMAPGEVGDEVSQVYVMYLPVGSDTFILKRLSNPTGDTWVGTVDEDVAEYFVQAVDGNGNVGLATFKGVEHPVEAEVTPAGIQVEITGTDQPNPVGEWYVGGATVDVSNTDDPTESFEASVDGGDFEPVPVTVNGEGGHIVEYLGDRGSEGVAIVPVDSEAPTIDLTVGKPRFFGATKTFVAPTTPLSVLVNDGASGVHDCAITVTGGGSAGACSGGQNPVTLTSTDGDRSIQVTARDEVGFATGLASHTRNKTFAVTVDGTAPTITCPTFPDPIYLNGPYTVTATANDGTGSGVDPVTSVLTIPLATGTVGLQTVTFTAVDQVGNVSTKGCNYRVVYKFTGFEQPIDNGIVNSAKAGQNIPVKWRITDYFGVGVNTTASFVSVTSTSTSSSSCGGTPDAVETYTNTSGLLSQGNGNWQFNWSTPASYKGQCRTMTLNLADGVTGRTARFIFR